MNRMNNRTPRLAALGLMLAAIAACTKTEINTNDDLANGLNPSSGAPIAFESQDAFTKAEGDTDPEAFMAVRAGGFKVWSWFQGTTSGPMFGENGTVVTDANYVADLQEGQTMPDPNWTYSPTRYWLNGTYDFAAVYPSTVLGEYKPAQTGGTPVLTVKDFDVTNQDDLLVAFNTGIDGLGRTSEDAVNLNFQHALSGVQIELRLKPEDFYEIEKDEDGDFIYDENGQPIYKTENGEKIKIGTAYVTKISFSNVSTVGSLSTVNEEIAFSDWAASETTNAIEFNYTNAPIVITDASTPCIKDGGLLIIPQNVADGDGEMSMELIVEFPSIVKEPIKRIVNIPLKAGAAKAPRWEPNTKYIYTAIIDQNFAIDFGLADVEVVGWKYGTLGGITVN